MSEKEISLPIEKKPELKTIKKSFDELVIEHKLSPAVARAVRTLMRVPYNGMVNANDFAKAVKQFTGAVPK